jgi:Lon protease-like protein
LQVFEPRYRTMVHDALQDEGLVAMALLRPGYEAYYYTNQARIYPVVCLGRIREHVRAPDGRYFMNLEGVCRARVREEDRAGDYRRALLEPMLPGPSGLHVDGEHAVRELLRKVLTASLFDRVAKVDECRALTASEVSLCEVVDRLAGDLLPREDVEIKQQILEEMDVLRRADMLARELHVLYQRLELRHRDYGEWPPPPSSN